MKPSRIILAALLFAAVLFGWLSVVSHAKRQAQPPQGCVIIVEPGIRSDQPNVEMVLQAIKQRDRTNPLPEPEVLTRYHLAANEWDHTFVFTVTNK